MADNNSKRYLDETGLGILVGQVKAEDKKVKDYAVELTSFTGTATKAVGGISVGDSFTDKSLKELLELMLSPYVPTTGIRVSAKNEVGGNVTTENLEKGDGFTIAKTYVSWTKGSTQVKTIRVYKGAFTTEPLGNESSPFYLGKAELTSGENTTIDITDVTVAVGSSTKVTLTAFVFDKDGAEVYSKQQEFGSWRLPYFYGRVTKNPDELTASEIVALEKSGWGEGKSKVTFGDTTVSQYIVFVTKGTVTSAKDPSGFENFATFTKKDVTLTRNNWSNEVYHMYYTKPGLQTAWFYTFA